MSVYNIRKISRYAQLLLPLQQGHKHIFVDTNIIDDRSKKSPLNLFSAMEWDNRGSSIRMLHNEMTSSLSGTTKSEI